MARTTLTLLADAGGPSGPVHEQIAAEALPDGTFRLLTSPGLVLGAAAGDIIEVAEDGLPRVLVASGNVALQVFADDDTNDALAMLLRPLGARMDGRIPETLTVFTLPGGASLDQVERVLEALVRRHPDVEWLYGNPQAGS